MSNAHVDESTLGLCAHISGQCRGKGCLDTSVYREPDGRPTTSVYRKPTHTDHYLAYDSHHPQSVKRGIVKCLYDRAKRLVTKSSVIAGEKKRLSSVLVSNRDIPPLLYRRSQRHEQPQEESLSRNLNPPPFYLMSKEFRSLSAAA